MNVTNKTTKTFTISQISEAQAQDLLSLSVKIFPTEVTASEKETLNNLRQALLSAGLQNKKGDENAS